MEGNTVFEVTEESFTPWLALGLELWPGHSAEELAEVFLDVLHSEKETAFLYKAGNEYAGFINVSIRSDYVEGSDSSPVGFVEGIFVKEAHRKKGIARELVKRAEEWALGRGCTQMGSDIEITNNNSYDFHTKIGFKEANRIICFIKDIKAEC